MNAVERSSGRGCRTSARRPPPGRSRHGRAPRRRRAHACTKPAQPAEMSKPAALSRDPVRDLGGDRRGLHQVGEGRLMTQPMSSGVMPALRWPCSRPAPPWRPGSRRGPPSAGPDAGSGPDPLVRGVDVPAYLGVVDDPPGRYAPTPRIRVCRAPSGTASSAFMEAFQTSLPSAVRIGILRRVAPPAYPHGGNREGARSLPP